MVHYRLLTWASTVSLNLIYDLFKPITIYTIVNVSESVLLHRLYYPANPYYYFFANIYYSYDAVLLRFPFPGPIAIYNRFVKLGCYPTGQQLAMMRFILNDILLTFTIGIANGPKSYIYNLSKPHSYVFWPITMFAE